MAEQGSIIPVEEYKKNFVKNKKGKKEEAVQIAVCEFIKKNYPDVIFMCDLASGLKLPIWIAATNKRMRSSRGLPDLFIAHPKEIISDKLTMMGDTFITGRRNGLFIEIKREGHTVYLKNGELSSDEHIREQAAILERLSRLGYMAKFACGYSECVKIIEEYLGLPTKISK